MSANLITTTKSSAPERVWMHNGFGYWFSVADECREEGDVEFVRAAEYEQLQTLAQMAIEADKWPRPLGARNAEQWIRKMAEIARAAITRVEKGE